MKDPVFLDAFYWLLMNRDFIIISISSLIFIAILIGLTYLIKNWGAIK